MANWFILPGMGATSGMYDLLRPKIEFEINFIDWPEYRGEKTYGQMAQRVTEEYNINDDDIIGGSSLGGMVALEIAKNIKPKAIVLLGSAIKRDEVQSVLAILSPLASVTPISLIQALAGKHKNIVTQMFADANPDFIRTMCTYLSSWSGYSGPMECVFRLHGKRDHVIPCPRFGCKVIENAGHLLPITHPKETGAFLASLKGTILSD